MGREIEVKTFDNLNEVIKSDYEVFIKKCDAPIFYHWNFLIASQNHHLLPIQKCLYILIYRGKELIAFCQSYLMKNADPFKVIEKSSGVSLNHDSHCWLSHIGHFYESEILCLPGEDDIKLDVLELLEKESLDSEAKLCGLVNVINDDLLNKASSLGWRVNPQWERFSLELKEINDIDKLLSKLHRDGRSEIRRQLRKFNLSHAECRYVKAPFADLEQVATLCFETTKKNGTPQYYPPKPLSQFIEECSEHTLIIEVRIENTILGALVCFEEKGVLHLWAGGMRYDMSNFSPYTICFYYAYLYALSNGMERIEAGRTNKKIKERLGFKPKTLYTIIKETN